MIGCTSLNALRSPPPLLSFPLFETLLWKTFSSQLPLFPNLSFPVHSFPTWFPSDFSFVTPFLSFYCMTHSFFPLSFFSCAPDIIAFSPLLLIDLVLSGNVVFFFFYTSYLSRHCSTFRVPVLPSRASCLAFLILFLPIGLSP